MKGGRKKHGRKEKNCGENLGKRKPAVQADRFIPGFLADVQVRLPPGAAVW